MSLPLPRKDLAKMLGVSPAQVNAIMASPLIRAEIEQLAYDPEEITIERIKRLIVEEGLLKSRTETT